MTSNKPYFIRALYEWILDNTCTPYIVVDATLPFVEVPEQFISEGRLFLISSLLQLKTSTLVMSGLLSLHVFLEYLKTSIFLSVQLQRSMHKKMAKAWASKLKRFRMIISMRQ